MPYRGWLWLSIGCLVAVMFAFAAAAGWSTEDEYLAEYSGADADYTGSETCLMCHTDYAPGSLFTHVALIDNNPANPDYGYGCEGCHGPGGNHMGDINGILRPAGMSVDGVTDLCSRCHSDLRAYDSQEWVLSEHYLSDISCLSCHSGHSEFDSFLVNEDPREVCFFCHSGARAQFNLRSHHPVEEGQLGCESCHNPHSGLYENQLVDDGDELCFSCHADKQGPFIYNHEVSMASGGDGCLTCHFSHGSNSDSLLRVPQGLCTQCHTDRGPQDHFGGTCWTAGCHVEIHGSNSHPLFFY